MILMGFSAPNEAAQVYNTVRAAADRVRGFTVTPMHPSMTVTPIHPGMTVTPINGINGLGTITEVLLPTELLLNDPPPKPQPKPQPKSGRLHGLGELDPGVKRGLTILGALTFIGFAAMIVGIGSGHKHRRR